MVDVLEEEEEGWWRGRIGNHEGVFPSNFVEEIEEEEPPKSTPEAPPPVDSQTGERREFLAPNDTKLWLTPKLDFTLVCIWSEKFFTEVTVNKLPIWFILGGYFAFLVPPSLVCEARAELTSPEPWFD